MKMKLEAMEPFEQYSQFESEKEFERYVEKILRDDKKVWTKGDRIALILLARCSREIPGVSNRAIDSVLEFMKEQKDVRSISRSTFKRMIGKAKALGILTVYQTEKENGYQLSNLYIFNNKTTFGGNQHEQAVNP